MALLHNRYRFSETITLASAPDGPYVTTEGSGHFVETKARLLDPAKPTIYQFTTVDAGTFRLYSSDGKVLVSSSVGLQGHQNPRHLGRQDAGVGAYRGGHRRLPR